MRIAITREVSPAIGRCELTWRERAAIDVSRARAQHAAYRDLLGGLGWTVVHLPALAEHPDSVFVEDAAVVLDELAVLARPGAASRRDEPALLAPLLSRFRRVEPIRAPGTLDGGDVVQAGGRVWVGRTSRTNDAGVAQLVALLDPLGYEVAPVDVEGCLHLKSAVTAVDDETLLVSPGHVDAATLNAASIIEVDPGEPEAANVLRVDEGAVAVAAAFPRTRERLEARGVRCHVLDASELARAEGALTCCSLLLRDQRTARRS